MKGRSTINEETESPCEVTVLFPSCSTFTTATPEDIIDQWSSPTIHCWTRVPWGGEYVFTPLQSWFDIKYFPQSLGEVNCSDWPPHKGKESLKHCRKFLLKRNLNPKEEGDDNDHNDDDDYHDEGDIYHNDGEDDDDNDNKGNAATTLLKRKLIKRNLSRL